MLTELNLTSTGSTIELNLDGQAISGRTWGTPSECRAAVLLVHGLGAHSGWFEALGRLLKVKRVYALAYDQLGFGKRQEQKFWQYRQWQDDLMRVFEFLLAQVKDKPIYIIGNSMGALIALSSAARLRPQGMVLLSPGLDGHPRTFTLSFKLKAIIQGLCKPDSEIELPYSSQLITRLENIRQWIDNDPEHRLKIPARMLTELLKLSLSLRKEYGQIATPLLMLTAGVDQIVDNRANSKFFATLPGPVKHHIHFPEAWHDLMFDPQIDEVAQSILDWMPQCCPEKNLLSRTQPG